MRLRHSNPLIVLAITIAIDDSAGFGHDFYIGADEESSVPNGITEIGIPDRDSGIQELQWVVPEDLRGIRFACTVPGHYFLMQGDFTVAP